MHKSYEQLHQELDAAAEHVAIEGIYAHYKNPDQTYKVTGLGITEWDDEICVMYRAQYDEALVFVRPLKSWLEKVEWAGGLLERFTRVE